MVFNLYGSKITIEDNLNNEFKLYTNFITYAQEACNSFRKFYYNCSNAETVAKRSRTEAINLYRNVAAKIIELLSSNNIFGISADDILSQHGHYKIDDVVDKLQGNIAEIERQRNAEQKYRDMRKAGRGRFVGGGFGLGGAVKGMAMAGAANMATGLAHSVVNVFGNVGSSLKHDSNLRRLYDSGICKDLVDAIYVDCMAFYDTQNDIFEQHNFQTVDIRRRLKESNTIYNQMRNKEIPESSIKNAVVKMLSLFPGDYDYYLLTAGLLGGSNGELKRCMESFGLDSEELQVLIDSYDFRKKIFGEFENLILQHERPHVHYLYEMLYDRYRNGAVLRLAEDNFFPGWLKDAVAGLSEDIKNSSCEVEIYLDGENWGSIALLIANGIQFDEEEVPLFGFPFKKVTFASLTKTSYIVVTTERIICDLDGSCDSFPITEVLDIGWGEEMGTFISIRSVNGGIAPYISGSADTAISLRDFLWELVLLLQCLHTVGVSNRKIPILSGGKPVGEIETAHNSIAGLFRPDYASLVGSLDELPELCHELFSHRSLYFRTAERIERDKKDGISPRLPKYNGETIVGEIHDGPKIWLILTDKNLYLKTKKKDEVAYPVNAITSFYYDWRFSEFYLNDEKIMNFYGNEISKAFCSLFWFMKPIIRKLKALEPQFEAERLAKQKDIEFVKNFVKSKLMEDYKMTAKDVAEIDDVISMFSNLMGMDAKSIVSFFNEKKIEFTGASTENVASYVEKSSPQKVAEWVLRQMVAIFKIEKGAEKDKATPAQQSIPEKIEASDSTKKTSAASTEAAKENSSEKICPSCNKANKSTARFCNYCGNPLEEPRFCTQCGTKLRPGKKFCSGCGAKIE